MNVEQRPERKGLQHRLRRMISWKLKGFLNPHVLDVHHRACQSVRDWATYGMRRHAQQMRPQVRVTDREDWEEFNFARTQT